MKVEIKRGAARQSPSHSSSSAGWLRLCHVALVAGFAGILIAPRDAAATEISATPSNYAAQLALVGAGDTLKLAAGTYTQQLYITNKNGSDSAWITIEGPVSGSAAVFTADPTPCCNTINISNSSFVALKHITVDGMGVAGAFAVSANGANNRVHDITIEGCTFVNHDASQQTVVISTKTPTWNWIIRGNRISGAGTGMYLGNSDGTDPFVAGIIEYNLFEDTIGYNIEVKWQDTWPTGAGLPTASTPTIIRYNVFSKTDRQSPDGDRPNLLVDGFPDTGPGSGNSYHIYGNFFYYNPREALIQASGRLVVHDNIMVTSGPIAMRLTMHDTKPLKLAHVYNNTVYATNGGISLAVTALEKSVVIGNLVFAATPISGTIDVNQDNIVDTLASASNYVSSPSFDLSTMDFYPLPAKAEGGALDVSEFTAEMAYDVDFNGASKGGFTFRGAYAGSGVNPGWPLALDIKDSVPTSPSPTPTPTPTPTPSPSPTPTPSDPNTVGPTTVGYDVPGGAVETGSVAGGCASVVPDGMSSALWIATLGLMHWRQRRRRYVK